MGQHNSKKPLSHPQSSKAPVVHCDGRTSTDGSAPKNLHNGANSPSRPCTRTTSDYRKTSSHEGHHYPRQLKRHTKQPKLLSYHSRDVQCRLCHGAPSGDHTPSRHKRTQQKHRRNSSTKLSECSSRSLSLSLEDILTQSLLSLSDTLSNSSLQRNVAKIFRYRKDSPIKLPHSRSKYHSRISVQEKSFSRSSRSRSRSQSTTHLLSAQSLPRLDSEPNSKQPVPEPSEMTVFSEADKLSTSANPTCDCDENPCRLAATPMPVKTSSTSIAQSTNSVKLESTKEISRKSASVSQLPQAPSQQQSEAGETTRECPSLNSSLYVNNGDTENVILKSMIDDAEKKIEEIQNSLKEKNVVRRIPRCGKSFAKGPPNITYRRNSSLENKSTNVDNKTNSRPGSPKLKPLSTKNTQKILQKPPEKVPVRDKSRNSRVTSLKPPPDDKVSSSTPEIKQWVFVRDGVGIMNVLQDPSDRRIKAACERFGCDLQIFEKKPINGYLQYPICVTALNKTALRSCLKYLDTMLRWNVSAQIPL